MSAIMAATMPRLSLLLAAVMSSCFAQKAVADGLESLIEPYSRQEFADMFWNKKYGVFSLTAAAKQYFGDLDTVFSLDTSHCSTLLSSFDEAKLFAFENQGILELRDSRGNRIEMAAWLHESNMSCAPGQSFIWREELVQQLWSDNPKKAPQAKIQTALADDFDTKISMHIYASGTNSQALGIHADPYDVFVVQLSGEKKWTLCPARTNDTTSQARMSQLLATTMENQGGCRIPGAEVKLDNRFECSQFLLTAGNVLYIPRDVLHFAQTEAHESVHASIGILREDQTFRAVASRACHDLHLESECRRLIHGTATRMPATSTQNQDDLTRFLAWDDLAIDVANKNSTYIRTRLLDLVQSIDLSPSHQAVAPKMYQLLAAKKEVLQKLKTTLVPSDIPIQSNKRFRRRNFAKGLEDEFDPCSSSPSCYRYLSSCDYFLFCFDGLDGCFSGCECYVGCTKTCCACEGCGEGYNVCNPGYYLPKKPTLKDVCLACPRGKFGGASDMRSCNECPAGKYNDREAQTSISVCKNCPAGKYAESKGQPSLNNCLDCPRGKYSTSEASTTCRDCPPGLTTSHTGTACVEVTDFELLFLVSVPADALENADAASLIIDIVADETSNGVILFQPNRKSIVRNAQNSITMIGFGFSIQSSHLKTAICLLLDIGDPRKESKLGDAFGNVFRSDVRASLWGYTNCDSCNCNDAAETTQGAQIQPSPTSTTIAASPSRSLEETAVPTASYKATTSKAAASFGPEPEPEPTTVGPETVPVSSGQVTEVPTSSEPKPANQSTVDPCLASSTSDTSDSRALSDSILIIIIIASSLTVVGVSFLFFRRNRKCSACARKPQGQATFIASNPTDSTVEDYSNPQLMLKSSWLPSDQSESPELQSHYLNPVYEQSSSIHKIPIYDTPFEA